MVERHSRSREQGASSRINQTIVTSSGQSLPPMHVPKPFAGFVDFVRTQGVVGLGVGFVVGTAANTLIKSVVTNLLNPFIGFLTGGINLASKEACINSVNGVCKNTLNYGQVISDFITFLAILMVVYFVVRYLKLDKLDKSKG